MCPFQTLIPQDIVLELQTYLPKDTFKSITCTKKMSSHILIHFNKFEGGI